MWFITGYRIQFSVLYSRTLLFIHPRCTSLHLLTPNSHSFPPPPPRLLWFGLLDWDPSSSAGSPPQSSRLSLAPRGKSFSLLKQEPRKTQDAGGDRHTEQSWAQGTGCPRIPPEAGSLGHRSCAPEGGWSEAES